MCEIQEVVLLEQVCNHKRKENQSRDVFELCSHDHSGDQDSFPALLPGSGVGLFA